MNVSSLFADPVQTVHLLSVFSYLNTLQDVFNFQNLTEKFDHIEPISTDKTPFDYFNKSDNELATERNLTLGSFFDIEDTITIENSTYDNLNQSEDEIETEKILTRRIFRHIEPIIIVNTFYEYLNQSDDQIATKRNLTRRLLQFSELYGGRINETLDLEYINETFDYIISNAVFSQFGNIYGYLADFVSQTKNLTFPSFKQAISDHLSNLEYFHRNGSVIRLSSTAVSRILETLILPLFPEPEEDITVIGIEEIGLDKGMKVIDVDYIYAQAGLMLARSARMNSTNLTFWDYKRISQVVELAALQKYIDPSVLRIFTLPALLHYAYHKKETFRKQRVANWIPNDDFWSKVFLTLFSHLDKSPKAVQFGDWKEGRPSENEIDALIETYVNRVAKATKLGISSEIRQKFEKVHSGMSFPIKKVKLEIETAKNISLDLIHSVDSGFEPLGKLNRRGREQVEEVLKSLWTSAKNMSKSKKESPTYMNIMNCLEHLRQSIDNEATAPVIQGKLEGYELFRQIYPGGVHPYGPKYVRLPGGTAEIRTTPDGFGIPVVISGVSKLGQVYYNKIDLKINQTFGLEMKLDQNGFLVPISLKLHKQIRTGGVREMLRKQRMEELEKAAELIAESSLQMDKEVAKRVMKSYFLATEDEQRENGDKIDENPSEKVPTYNEFARALIENKKVTDAYEKWLINNPQQLDKLLYDSELDHKNRKHVLAANDEILALYGPFYQEEFEFHAEDLIKYYDLDENQDLVNFADFYAITNWITNSRFEMTENVDAGRLRQIAFYRLAIRQIHAEQLEFPQVLYRLEPTDKYFVEKDLENSKTFRTYRWLAASREKNLTSLAEGRGYEHIKDKVLVLYEIQIDSKYLTANLNSVAPNAKEEFLIQPNVNFRIDEVTRVNVGDNEIVQVKMRNEPFGKAAWVRHMVKRLETIEERGNRLQ